MVYLNVGLRLLAQDSWKSQYDLTLAIYVEATQAEYLNLNFDRAKNLSDIVLENAKTLLEKVQVYELLIDFYTSVNKLREGLDMALSVLKMLGVSLPANPTKLMISYELVRTSLATGGRKRIEKLANLPEMTDAYKIAAMRILLKIFVCTYNVAPNLLPLITFKMIELCIKYGNSPSSPHAYSTYGMILCGAGNIDSGYQFGQLAVKLLAQMNARSLKPQVYMLVNTMISHWKDHLRETTAPA